MVLARALPPSPARLRTQSGSLRFSYDQTHAVGFSVIGLTRLHKQPEHMQSLICEAGAADKAVQAQLFVLSDDAKLGGLPAARRSGILRGASQIAGHIAVAQTPEPLDWWIALQFAYRGFLERSDYLQAAVAAGGRVRGISGASEHNRLYIWNGFIERKSAELIHALQRAVAKNPYLDLLKLPRAMEWLDIDQPTVAARILRETAQRLGTGVIDLFTGPALRVPPMTQRPRGAAMAEEIFARYDRGDGLTIARLRKDYPGQHPLIGKLLDAGLLIESPEGFVFTQLQLNDFTATLGLRTPKSEVPGVGDIKKKTNLPRKDAEQLRELLLQLKTEGLRGSDDDG